MKRTMKIAMKLTNQPKRTHAHTLNPHITNLKGFPFFFLAIAETASDMPLIIELCMEFNPPKNSDRLNGI